MKKGLLLAVLETLEWVVATALAVIMIAATVEVQARLDRALGLGAASTAQGEGAAQRLQVSSAARVN
jgi:hypothetical protein